MVITFSNIRGSGGGGGIIDELSAYTPTSGFSTINGSAITTGEAIVIEETEYSAGTNINIANHVISVTGITIPTKLSDLQNDEGFITTADTQNFVTSGDVETQITSKGYLTAYTETDPVFMTSAASGITSNDISNWNSKLDASALTPYYTSAQTDTAISNAVSGKVDSSAVTAQISEVKAEIEAEIPTKVSDLQNDLNFASTGDVESMISGFTTSADVKTQIESYNYINSGQAQTQIDNSISGKLDTSVFNAYSASTNTILQNKVDTSAMTQYATTAFTENTYAKKGDIPTKTSDLTNDSGFITNAALSGYATEQYVDNSVSGKADTSAVTASIAAATAATTGWVENQGYLTAYTETDPVFMTSAASGITSQDITNWDAKADTSALTETNNHIGEVEQVTSVALNNLETNKVGSTDVHHMSVVTQAQYDTMAQGGTLDSSTFYIIL